MPRSALIMLLLVTTAVACNRNGTCLQDGDSKSSTPDVCIVNAVKEVCGKSGIFTPRSSGEGVKFCRSQGYRFPSKINGKYTSDAEVDEDAAKGTMIHFYKK